LDEVFGRVLGWALGEIAGLGRSVFRRRYVWGRMGELSIGESKIIKGFDAKFTNARSNTKNIARHLTLRYRSSNSIGQLHRRRTDRKKS
jgi:hypothetical protein